MDSALIIIVIMIAIILLGIIASGYVKAPPDVAYIISGLNKKPKILIGKAGVKIPFLERKDVLLVRQITVDIKTEGYVPTLDFIGVDIDAVAKVKVSTKMDDPDAGIYLAMRNFLNLNDEGIAHALQDSLQGNMREIIGTVTLKELCTDRKKFGDEVQSKAQTDMNALGIEILSCNIQKITDERDLITALGQDNMSQIQKDASIAKANADKEVAIAEAEAKKASNEATVAAETEIAIKQNELAIKQAELKRESDIKKAEADAATEIEAQNQRKTIEVNSANADIARQEREIELKQKAVEVKERTLEAEVKKQAEADKYAAQQKAEAELFKRQKEAEARKFEEEKQAEAQKAKADAARYEAEQIALGIKAQGVAEAEAIKAKGIAEAEAIEAQGKAEAEAMDKKAEAYAKYNQAAITEMIVKTLPEIAKAVAEPFASVDNITVFDQGGSGEGGMNAVADYTPQLLAKTIETVKAATGFDITEILKADTYDAKVNQNVTLSGAVDVSGKDAAVKNETIKAEVVKNDAE